jgi:hypothetical protein
MLVESKLTNFIIWGERCFETLFGMDSLQFEHKNTNYLFWHKSRLELFINTIMLHVERHTGVY